MFNYSGSFLYASVMLHHGWFEDCMDMFKYAQYISYLRYRYIYIYTVTTLKYVEGGPDREAQEVV